MKENLNFRLKCNRQSKNNITEDITRQFTYSKLQDKNLVGIVKKKNQNYTITNL